MNEKPNSIRLRQIAHARSGDKGNHANIGVIARNEIAFEFLKQTLTANLVESFFSQLEITQVERFELPGIGALNFLLHDALQGGASQGMRTDSQGKVLAIALLELELPVDQAWNSKLQPDSGA